MIGTIEEEMKRFVDDFGLSEDRAFVVVSAKAILSLDDEDSLDNLTDGKNDLGLDFGWIDKSTKEIVLIQSKDSKNITRETIRATKSLAKLLDDAGKVRRLKANDEVRLFAREFRKSKKDGFRIRTAITCRNRVSSALKAELDGIEIYSSNDLVCRLNDQASYFGYTPPKQVDFVVDSTSFFKFPDRQDRPRCFVVNLPLRDLNRWYFEHRSGLFDANIRLHAGTGTNANKGILNTIRSSGDAHNFVYYNNGISILCNKIKHQASTDGTVKFELLNPQIVNGAQTTATIGQLDEDEVSDEASVIAQIMAPSQKKSEVFVERVIRYKNTQTPVKTRDFRSNDDIQKRIQELMAKEKPAYFFQRKVGEFDSLPRVRKSEFKKKGGGRYRVIDNERAAQCRLAWTGTPAAAKNRKRLIFTLQDDGGMYEEIFPLERVDKTFVAETILAFEINERFVEEKKRWNRESRRLSEDKASNEDAIKRHERDRFLLHFNFFGTAAIGFLMRELLADSNVVEVRQIVDREFDELFKRIAEIFRRILRIERKSNESFNLNAWFKDDDNFSEHICEELDCNREDFEQILC